jgi:hypothetical protein
MEAPWPPEPPASPQYPRRCRRCYYVIDHLGDTGVCPECGNAFDLANPLSYTTKPPVLWWTLWLPGLITSVLCGFVMYLVLIPNVGYGWTTVIIVPGMVGVILGYRTNVSGWLLRVLFTIMAVIGLAVALLSGNLAGAFCTLVMSAIALIPIAVGMAIGSILRWRMKQSKFSQRMHLPIIMLATIAAGFIEGRPQNIAMVSTRTSVVMHAMPETAWAAIQFYEQVKHRPPLLLWITPTFRPKYTTGQSGHVGDVKICVYERGRLVKQVTEVIPGKRLAFRVIEQSEIQTRGVRLIDGSFDFEPVDGGTRVKLTTRYTPLLEPRFAFLPAENLAVHMLHGHVLRGMSEDAEKR